MRVVYIAQYADVRKDVERYEFSPAGVAKMDYFLYCLKEMGIDTSVFSLCLSRKNLLQARQCGVTALGQPILFAFTFKPASKLITFIGLRVLQLQLFLRLLFSKKDEVFLVYHERFYSPAIRLACRLRKLNVVIDVEEIYSIHAQLSPQIIQEEIDYLKSFNRHILANIHLAEELEVADGQYVVCNGVYAPIQATRKTAKNGNRIGVLYAGTFNKAKGGAQAAIEAIKHLDEHFKLYVCGFGTDKETTEIKDAIDDINSSKGYEAISYEGFVPNTSERYAELLETCDIGLSTQNNAGKYNATSFPSKIFEYIRHGLKVVSTVIPGAENLPVSKYITFIHSNSPEDISEGITSATHIEELDRKDSLLSMHHSFKKDLSKLMFD